MIKWNGRSFNKLCVWNDLHQSGVNGLPSLFRVGVWNKRCWTLFSNSKRFEIEGSIVSNTFQHCHRYVVNTYWMCKGGWTSWSPQPHLVERAFPFAICWWHYFIYGSWFGPLIWNLFYAYLNNYLIYRSNFTTVNFTVLKGNGREATI